jgi:RNA polymerase sigma factor (sigma-70 family)
VISPILTYLNLYRTGTTEKDRTDCAEEIYALIEGFLRSYIYSRLIPSVAEDILQQTVIAIVTSLQKCRATTEEDFRIWYCRVARNKVNDHLRKKYSDRLEFLPPGDVLEVLSRSVSYAPYSSGDWLDLEQILNLLEKLKPGCRNLLWNHHAIELRHTELAKEMGLKAATVQRRIERCLEKAQHIARRLK